MTEARPVRTLHSMHPLVPLALAGAAVVVVATVTVTEPLTTIVIPAVRASLTMAFLKASPLAMAELAVTALALFISHSTNTVASVELEFVEFVVALWDDKRRVAFTNTPST